MMTRKKLAAVIAAVASGALLAAGVAAAVGTSLVPGFSAFAAADTSGDPPAGQAEAGSLVDAVSRWDTEHPVTSFGRPLASRQVTLLTGLGAGNDTLRAFPTERRGVCYEVKEAGTCARFTTERPLDFSLLSTKDGGSRLYGVAQDTLTRLQIEFNDDTPAGQAQVTGNAFYYALPGSMTGADVAYVVGTFADGNVSRIPFHPTANAR